MGALGQAFVEVRARMDQLAGDLADAESQVNTRMRSISDGMNKVGEGMSKAISAPFLALGAVLLKSQSDALNSVGQIQAALGVTGDEAKKLAATSQELWTQGFGENLEEVNASLITVKQGLSGINDEDLEATTAGAMSLAQIMGDDVNAVVKGTDGLMQTFGLSSQQALDLLTVGTQKGANETGELLDVVREYGPLFNNLGFSAEDMMATLVAGADNAAFTTDLLADAFKEFSLRVVDGSKGTSEAMQGLGLDADNMAAAIAKGGPEAAKATETILTKLAGIKDPLEQNRIGIQLFGTQWEDLGGSVLLASVESTKALGDITGANKEAQDAIMSGNPMQALQIAGRELSAAIGPIMQPFIDVILTKVVPAVQSFSEKFAALPQPMKSTIGVIGAVVAAIGPMLLVLAKVVSIGVTLFTNLSKLKTAFAFVRVAIMAIGGPVTIVIGIIVGLIAIFVKLYQENEKFRDTVNAVWNAIKSFFLAVVGAIKDAFVRDWNEMKTTATAVWEGIKTATEAVWNGLKAFLTALWTGIKAAVQLYFDAYKLIITTVWNAIKTATSAVWEGIKTALTTIWNVLKTTITTTFNFYKTLITGVWNAIKTVTTTVWNAIKTLLTTVWNAIKTTATSVWNGLKTTLTNAWNSIKSTATSAFNSVKTSVTNVWNGLKTTVTNAANTIRDKVKAAFTNIKTSMSGIWGGITGAIKSALNTAISAINKFINGVNSAIDKINAVPGVANLPKIPTIPMLAKGGNILADGLAIVGESGPELLNLPRGARVSPLSGGSDIEGTGRGGGMKLVQHIQAQATPQDLQRYTERALRKIASQAGLIF